MRFKIPVENKWKKRIFFHVKYFIDYTIGRREQQPVGNYILLFWRWTCYRYVVIINTICHSLSCHRRSGEQLLVVYAVITTMNNDNDVDNAEWGSSDENPINVVVGLRVRFRPFLILSTRVYAPFAVTNCVESEASAVPFLSPTFSWPQIR